MKKLGLLGLLLGSSLGLVLLVASCQGAAGTTGPQGAPGPVGPAGAPGPLASGTARQLNASISISKPANGTFFAAGEQPVITITLKDQSGQAFKRVDDFSQLRLMASGPIETADTTTAVKLLNTTADRTKTIHHYIDLNTNTDVQVNGATLTYKLQAVSTEKPGTYTAAVWSMLKADGLQQDMSVADFQIGTATAEKQIVEKEKCAVCHLGAQSGKFYLHHVDPAAVGQTGNWSLDSLPVKDCKVCHNNDGYSAYALADGTRVADPIVNRVHGVHMGEELSNPVNTDPKTGVFKHYTGVIFPANVKNCINCHVDDRWKTKPSRMACGACHDNVDFASGKNHKGGAQTDDKNCALCHGPDTGAAPISVVHKVTPASSLSGATVNKIDITLTPPANGKFYVKGEKPLVSAVIKDDNGAAIDHTKVDTTAFATASLFVYGPRYYAQPVLTASAKNGISLASASATSSIAASGTPAVWSFVTGDTFKIAVNGGEPQVLTAPTGAQTPDQVRDWLTANLKGVTVTSNNTANSVTIASTVKGAGSMLAIYNSAVTTKMGWKPGPLPLIKNGVTYGQTVGTTVEPFVVVANVSLQPNDLRSTTDTNVVRAAGKITYQLDDVASLQPGTYMVYSYTVPTGIVAGTVTAPGPAGTPSAAAKALNISREALGLITFQVGTDVADKKVATNCNTCHADTIWHLDEGPIHSAPFDTDYCLACHDYSRSGTGDLFSRVGGNSTSGWAGYGAKPISARVHGVHFGNYLTHPEWVYAGNPNAFNEIIFPQDVRNCQKCHSADTNGKWESNPNRLACSACHDSNSAINHMDIMTQNPNPADPYDPKRVETCTVCHGVGRDFAVTKVHNISTPFSPPYPREKE